MLLGCVAILVKQWQDDFDVPSFEDECNPGQVFARARRELIEKRGYTTSSSTSTTIGEGSSDAIHYFGTEKKMFDYLGKAVDAHYNKERKEGKSLPSRGSRYFDLHLKDFETERMKNRSPKNGHKPNVGVDESGPEIFSDDEENESSSDPGEEEYLSALQLHSLGF